MAKSQTSHETQDQLHTFLHALDSGAFDEIRRMLRGMSPAEIAKLIESSPLRARNLLWQLIDKEDEGEVLQYVNEELAAYFLRHRNTEDILSLVEGFDADDFADLLQELPHAVMRQVLDSLDDQNRYRIETILAYPEDTAGGLMDTDIITIRPDISLDVVLRYLRRHESLPDTTDNLHVVNRTGQFVGILPLTKLLIKDPGMSVREAMNSAKAIPATTSARDVAQMFEREDLVTAPVVDDNGVLLGRITIDDVVDVILEGADHSLMSMAGMDEDEDTFAPVWKTTRRRAVWLGINLLTAFLASYMIGLFEGTLEKVVALAVLMPIVASMGGIAGNQTLTLVIRGMALGHVGTANARWLLTKEISVGFLNGILWSAVVGAIAATWFNDLLLGGVLAAAMIINLLVAALAGASLPMLLDKAGIDPALSGGVILTTVTDVVGFCSFLGLATLYYA
ncbi:MAG: magnesium transporter [Pseudomonadales bacterium]|uniref:magnesium transporter n=1 Tax=unclassified Ketobacter TaxID=2639109 RepID=UPI000C6369EF|nr:MULTISPECIES: magnesium transporter [unclassified Ketobacter]MAA59452.1 magnesium transporter [Pseudomonadales bacterium]MEC8811118.1 magnesium transporter [Pseudomonadota bacterium]TNC88622.1 MAG: magnesium transporter [Alcanivorax sp.]HAG93375.1 magnesium transporter [Gammaproteobacteria bacterium]MAQ25404.1 magnesium transporter [Pseudomonadales bacterium]